MSGWEVFAAGFIGALAPEILRLYTLRSRPPAGFSWFYVIISVVFASLGGVIALALPATTLWGALYTGISTPVLINTALKKAGSSGEPLRDASSAGRPMIRPNFAVFVRGL